jgi:demethylmenaquinone methyltransferase/2-methoxy-6-polyprenyl-1,4-benzoquinol methylase
MSRVLTPGGHLLILDFSLPRPPLDTLYRLYLHRVLPLIAGLLTKQRPGYEYLGESIESFPSGQAMLDLISQNGLTAPKAHPLAAGIVSIYTAKKPSLP